MPYVQRDREGKIKGLYACKQLGTAEEFLEEDHSEVSEFRLRFPCPPIRAISEEEAKKLHAELERVDTESKELNRAILNHIQAWAGMETALSAVLYETLHLYPRSSHIAYAIYYSLDSFEARRKLMTNVIHQFVVENPEMESLEAEWKHIDDGLKRAKDLRNMVAHSAPTVYAIRGQQHVRLAPLPFDVNKAGRLIPKGTIPGKTGKEVQEGIQSLFRMREEIDAINTKITAYAEDREKPRQSH